MRADRTPPEIDERRTGGVPCPIRGVAPLALLLVCAACRVAEKGAPSRWPAPVAPVVAQADGYAPIPNAAVSPETGTVYRAIFDATRAAADPKQLLPAVNMAGSELNALATAKVPLSDAKFAIVFHGATIDGLLDETHYRAKYRVGNPNLPAIAALKKAGVELFVCGQQLAADDVDLSTLTPDVIVASDALIVLMTYHDKGYAILGF
jgi:intracellular sulfur oxidation DsrE/DsrF family protein